ncbi:MAG: hypothetical protein ACRCVE_04285 [Plesiomonas sp.]
MIPVAHALTYSLQRSRSFHTGDRLGVFSFKKDRGYWVEKTAEDAYRVSVFGFVDQTLHCDFSQLRTILKPVIAREFPRSNKLHVKFMAADPQMALTL